MKHKHNIPHEMPKNQSRQPNAGQKNQLPPSDTNLSDVPLKQPTAEGNEWKRKTKGTTAFTKSETSDKTNSPVPDDSTKRLL